MPGGFQKPQPLPEEESNIHYGRIPQRVPRRFKTTKKVELRIIHLVEPRTPALLLKYMLTSSPHLLALCATQLESISF